MKKISKVLVAGLIGAVCFLLPLKTAIAEEAHNHLTARSRKLQNNTV